MENTSIILADNIQKYRKKSGLTQEEVFGNIVCDSSINGDVICHGNVNCYEINGDVTAETVEENYHKLPKQVIIF